MLALSRQVGETIVMSDGVTTIEVKVIRISGDKVRLGFDAPRHVSIDRTENIADPKHEQLKAERMRRLARQG